MIGSDSICQCSHHTQWGKIWKLLVSPGFFISSVFDFSSKRNQKKLDSCSMHGPVCEFDQLSPCPKRSAACPKNCSSLVTMPGFMNDVLKMKIGRSLLRVKETRRPKRQCSEADNTTGSSLDIFDAAPSRGNLACHINQLLQIDEKLCSHCSGPKT